MRKPFVTACKTVVTTNYHQIYHVSLRLTNVKPCVTTTIADVNTPHFHISQPGIGMRSQIDDENQAFLMQKLLKPSIYKCHTCKLRCNNNYCHQFTPFLMNNALLCDHTTRLSLILPPHQGLMCETKHKPCVTTTICYVITN